MSIERVVILGPPASGKGTQVRLLTDRLGLPVASTGQMLRDEEARGSEIGLYSIELSKTGTLVPDAIVIDMVQAWIGLNGGKFLFDGFPRTVPQAHAFDRLLAEKGMPLDVVIGIEIPEEVIRERALDRLTCEGCGQGVPSSGRRAETERCASCGGRFIRRRDDSAHVFDLRMDQYRSKTVPVIDYYAETGQLRTIDGSGTANEVFDLILELVE